MSSRNWLHPLSRSPLRHHVKSLKVRYSRRPKEAKNESRPQAETAIRPCCKTGGRGSRVDLSSKEFMLMLMGWLLPTQDIRARSWKGGTRERREEGSIRTLSTGNDIGLTLGRFFERIGGSRGLILALLLLSFKRTPSPGSARYFGWCSCICC